jgi:hypothetical protein
MTLLDGGASSFWDGFQDTTHTRLVSAVFKKDKIKYRQLSVDPSSINFIIESSDGIAFEKLESNEDFHQLFKRIKSLCEEFGIIEIKRAGIRIVSLSQIGIDGYNLAPLFEKLFSSSMLNDIHSTIGQSYDYGMSLDGSDPDKSKYHFTFGPYTKDEAKNKRYVEHVEVNDANLNFFCDIDMYEEGFSFEGINPVTWTKPFIVKASKLIKKLEQNLDTVIKG